MEKRVTLLFFHEVNRHDEFNLQIAKQTGGSSKEDRTFYHDLTRFDCGYHLGGDILFQHDWSAKRYTAFTL